MFRKIYRPKFERLEERRLFAVDTWFEDSGQVLGRNHDAVELADLDSDGDLDLFFGLPQSFRSSFLFRDGGLAERWEGEFLQRGGPIA